ncbi:MAG TPA: DUF1800 domain-containing protein [Gemmataceae bacterium]|nr:DUF1800 domain-containing protein [Gemmataceae bacterium]
MMDAALDPVWAWEPYRPSPQEPWDLRKVGHLYRRAAFGASHAELEKGLRAGPERAIDHLLAGGDGQDKFDSQTQGMVPSIERVNNGFQARAWWLYRMLYSPHPLKEKLTLFWHNHFATSNAKVNNAGFMLEQYALLYRHALASFRDLLQDISKNPAMLVWLDTNLSKKGMPNENYARELMELFSLGIGNYTEADVREAAKAFTGWEISDRKARFVPARHDDSVKTILGQKGKWTGADIVRICLEQQSASPFIVNKLYRFLISETAGPTPALIAPLAERFRKSNYDFGDLVQTMLRSNLFFAPAAYRAQVKSPICFALGIVHGLEGRVGTPAMVQALEELGQNVGYPPSVKGWDGGPAWLNGQTLLSRQNLALALTSTEDARFGRHIDPAELARRHDLRTDDLLVQFVLDLFLQGDVAADTRARLMQYLRDSAGKGMPAYWSAEDAADHRIRTVCYLVLTLPEFQLA